MKKILYIVVVSAAALLFASCNKDNGGKKEDGRPVCTKVVFSIASEGYSEEILKLFRINISGVDFDGKAFSNNGSAGYNVSFTKENISIASSEDHYPISVKVSVDKIAEPDASKTYTFPHTFYIQAEFYDANGKKLNVSSFSSLADQKIDRVVYSQGNDADQYKGDRIERKVRSLELEHTYVFFRHEKDDIFCCTTTK